MSHTDVITMKDLRMCPLKVLKWFWNYFLLVKWCHMNIGDVPPGLLGIWGCVINTMLWIFFGDGSYMIPYCRSSPLWKQKLQPKPHAELISSWSSKEMLPSLHNVCKDTSCVPASHYGGALPYSGAKQH